MANTSESDPTLQSAFEKMSSGTGLSRREAEAYLKYCSEQEKLEAPQTVVIPGNGKNGDTTINIYTIVKNSPTFNNRNTVSPTIHNEATGGTGGNATSNSTAEALAKLGPVEIKGSGCLGWLSSHTQERSIPETPVRDTDFELSEALNAWYRTQIKR